SELAPVTLARHDAYFLDTAARYSARVERAGDIHARELLARDYENLLEVHARAVVRADSDPAAAERAVSALAAADAVMSTQASAELRARLWEETWRAVSKVSLSADLVVRTKGALGRALVARGDHARGEAMLREAVGEAKQRAPELEPTLSVDLGVALHARRDLDGARAAYLAAVSANRNVDDARARARALGNLGALDHDEQKPEAARRSYERSVELAAAVSDPRIEGIMLTNLALLDQEEGALDVAERRYERALRLVAQAKDVRLVAITEGNFAMLLAERGRLDQAVELQARALQALASIGDHRSLGLGHTRLAALLGASSRSDEAMDHVAQARAAFAVVSDDVGHALTRVAEAFLEIGGGDDAHARARRVRDLAPLESDDARALVRLLDRSLAERERGAPRLSELDPTVLVIGPRAAAFRPPRGRLCSIEDHQAAHRIFARLVAERRASPGDGLDASALTEVGWPGEKMRIESAKNRLYVVVAWLRKQGLEGILVRRPGGYLLDPEIPIDVRDVLSLD
ncbi:MAG TPA: tetratricopeptide repeat protein, partial [Polyangiaceae bacterium]|nr:tetratricopeptide repeat protein [Polyangiaceae bacterium]